MAPVAQASFGPAAPTCSAAGSPRVTPNGSATQPGCLARCAPPGPRSDASRLRARRQPLSDEQGRGHGGTYQNLRLAPPKSLRRLQSSRDRALGALARRVLAEPGRQKALPVSTARPRSVCGAVSAGCTWGNFALLYRAPGRRQPGRSSGPPRPLCTAPGAFRPWEPAPPAHPDTAVPRAASGTRRQSRTRELQGPVQRLSPAILGFSAAPAWTPRRCGFHLLYLAALRNG